MRKPAILCALSMLCCAGGFAAQSWVVFGAALGVRTGCNPSFNWVAEPVFHNTADSDRQIVVRHQSGAINLPSTFTISEGESVPLSAIVGGPPLTIGAVLFDTPDDVVVEPQLEYQSVQPCGGSAPPLGPSGKIKFAAFELKTVGRPQYHYGLDLGIQSVRTNVGIYNAASVAATATIDLNRTACDARTTQVVTIPPDTLIQVAVPVPPICTSPVRPRTPMWMLEGVVTVDEPSFSYFATLSTDQAPHITFGLDSR